MKTLIAFALFFICMSIICYAQDDNAGQKEIALSVRGGLNLANHTPMSYLTNGNSHKWMNAYNLGVTCDYKKSEKFHTRTGLLYSAKGFKDDYVPYTHLNYLEMPVLAVFQKPVANLVTFEVQAGLYFACGISGERKAEDLHGGYTYEPCFKDGNPSNVQYKRFDWGWNVGAGINVGRIYIGGAYEVSALFGKRHTNHCFMLNVGYRIW
ncbi:MAG: PorT family protein [Bacteroidales bacterium]|nr:PorT family protein [Bacteroidales bacterium]